MTCGVQVPLLGGAAFYICTPETIAARHGDILSWNSPELSQNLRTEGPDKDGTVRAECTTEGRVHYTAVMIPHEDFVDVKMTVENLGKDTWRDVFAFNCVNSLPTAPQFKDWKLERTYLSAQGRPLKMAETRRVIGPVQPTLQFYLSEQTPWGQESAFVRNFGAVSPDRTDDSWIVSLSDPPGSYMAADSCDSLFLFDNLDRGCIHSAVNFGDIGPGQTSATVCRMYFAKGGLEDFLARRRKDRAELAELQKWAQPRRARIALTPVPPPAPGAFGVPALRIKAPWMEGPVELRMPESLRSSLGLHFADHNRAGMPPPAMPDPFPQWSVDEKTGECSYRSPEAKGVELSARVRPYEEEIFLEFRAKNTTGNAISNLWHQECLDVKDSPEFGMTEHVEHADDSRRSDPIADRDVIARVSKDGGHLLAMWWENAPIPIADSDISCLRSGPGHWPTLAPGDEAVWRGKIYLMKNDPDALLRRRRGDGGEWLYPEITERLEQQRQEEQKQ